MNTQTLKDRIVLLLINEMSTEAATAFSIQQGQCRRHRHGQRFASAH